MRRSKRFALGLRWVLATLLVLNGALTQFGATANALAQAAPASGTAPCAHHDQAAIGEHPDDPLPCCIKHACDCDFVHSVAIVLGVPIADDPMPAAGDFAAPVLSQPPVPLTRPLRPPIA
jgi:hypothetical protein